VSLRKIKKAYAKCVVELDRNSFSHYCNVYDIIIIDLASIVYGLKNPKEFLLNLALARDYVKSRFIIVLDYLEEKHKVVSNRYIKLLEHLHLEYILSENESAELKAARMCREFEGKGFKCIVLSRDYDVLQIIDKMLQPIKVSEKSWIVRRVGIDRECVNTYL